MKKFSHYIFLSCLLAFSIVINAQKPTEITREAAELMSKGNIRGAIAVLDKGIEKKKDLFEIYRMRSFLRPMDWRF